MQAYGPDDAFLSLSPHREPKLTVSIQKRDTGYVIDLHEAAKRERPKTTHVPTEEEINDKLDSISEGFAAFLGSIYDRADGEEWKGEEAKAKIRDAIKAFAPSIASPMEYRTAPMPRMEQRIFEKKADLIKYLETNL